MVCSPGGSACRHIAAFLHHGTGAAHRGSIPGRMTQPQWCLFGLAEPESAVQSGVSRLETECRQQHKKASVGIGGRDGTRLSGSGGAGCARTPQRGRPNGRMQRHKGHHHNVLPNAIGGRRDRRHSRPSTTLHRVVPVTTASRHGPVSMFPGNIDSSELLAGVSGLPGGRPRWRGGPMRSVCHDVGWFSRPVGAMAGAMKSCCTGRVLCVPVRHRMRVPAM